MKVLRIIRELGKPVYTTDEIRRAGAGRNLRQPLSSLVRKGHVLRLKKGEYCLPQAMDEAPYAVATGIVEPSYISLMSAYYLHGLTEQVPEITYVLNAKKSGRIGRVRLIKIRPSMMFGYFGENGYLLAEPEKAIIDSLCLQGHVSLDETAKALSCGKLDCMKLAEYAIKAGKSVVQRLGFLLKSLGIPANKAVLGLLRKNMGRGYVLLEAGGGRTTGYDAEWKIRINREGYAGER